MIFKEIYNHSPLLLQDITRIVYSKFKKPIWKNPAFIKWYNFLEESQWWPREKLEKYQTTQFKKLLNHTYENVLYYRKIFDQRGIKPKTIQSLSDLKKLPYLTRKDIQENLSDLTAQNWPKSRLEYVNTAGSTGVPLSFYQDKDVAGSIEWAFMLSQWRRVGYRFGEKSIILRGGVVQSVGRGKFWEHASDGSLVLSSYHLTSQNLPKYIEMIRKFSPDFIQAYPSSATILARYMREHNIKPFSSVKAILCGSENLYDWQRRLIKDMFGCRAYGWYGHAERAVLAGECEESTDYHIFPEYGIVELIDKNGQEVEKEGELGEIVATGLNNLACPLIRYRTKDFAVLTDKKCKCGRNHSLLKRVEGRAHEFVVSKAGRLISIAAINMHSPIFDNIEQFQFYQNKVGEVDFNLIPKKIYTEKDTDDIKKELKQKLGSDTKVNIKFVDNINRAPSGKVMFLIQKLPINLTKL